MMGILDGVPLYRAFSAATEGRIPTPVSCVRKPAGRPAERRMRSTVSGTLIVTAVLDGDAP